MNRGAWRFTVHLSLLLMLGAGGFMLSGCDALSWIPGMGPKEEAAAHGEAAHGHEEELSNGGEEELSPEEKALAKLPAALREFPYEEITIPTSDKVLLTGRLYDPAQVAAESEEEEVEAEDESESAEPRYPLVILLPGLNRDHLTWGDFPVDLVQAGYAVLALDLRGHGASNTVRGGRRFSWRFFQNEHWQRMPKDVNEVLQYFRKSEDYPQVDVSHTALIGEKLGANVAVMAARNDKKSVQALVLLSPGRNYKGLDPSASALEYPHAVLIMAGNADEYSFTSSQTLYRLFGGAKKMDLYQDTSEKRMGSGSDMIINDPALKTTIIDWLKQSLPAGPVEPPQT